MGVMEMARELLEFHCQNPKAVISLHRPLGCDVSQVQEAKRVLETVPRQDARPDPQRLFKQAGTGDVESEYRAGTMLLKGETVSPNFDEGRKRLRLAAEKGHVEAQYDLGLLYEQGLYETTVDCQEAARWFQMAAEMGHAKAQICLGLLHFNGTGVPLHRTRGILLLEGPQNLRRYPDPEARELFAAAREMIDFQSKYPSAALSLSRPSRPGIVQKPTDAENLKPAEPPKTEFERIEALAESGNAEAEYLLGSWYKDGIHVTKDPSEALRLFRLSAEQGNPKAQVLLGRMFDSGEGTSPDKGEAFKLFYRAAKSGYVPGAVELGKKYDAGEGVHEDPIEAFAWFSLAVTRGSADSEAMRRMNALQGRFDWMQKDSAQWRARALNREIPNYDESEFTLQED